MSEGVTVIEARFSDGWKTVDLVGWKDDSGCAEPLARVTTKDGRSALMPRAKLRGLPATDPKDDALLEALRVDGYTLNDHVPWQECVKLGAFLHCHPSTVLNRFHRIQKAGGIEPQQPRRGKKPEGTPPVLTAEIESTGFFAGTIEAAIDRAAELERERQQDTVAALESGYTPEETARFNEMLEQGRQQIIQQMKEASEEEPEAEEETVPDYPLPAEVVTAPPGDPPPPCPGTPELRPVKESYREVERLCGSLLDANEMAILVAAKVCPGIYAAFSQLPADRAWDAERKARWLAAVKAAADLEIDGKREEPLGAKEKRLAALLAVGSLSSAGVESVNALEPDRRLLVLWRAIEVLNAVVR